MTDAANNYSAVANLSASEAGNRATPRFSPLGQIFLSGKTVISDVDGNLWQIDADSASMRRVAKA